MLFIKRMVLLAMCVFVSLFSNAQKADSVQTAYFNKKLALISVETDMVKRKQLANELMTEAAILEGKPAMQNIVERARMEQTRFFLIDGNYTSFKQNFDKLPVAYKDFLVQSGYSYLVKDPQGAKFAVGYLENMKAQKQFILDSVMKISGLSRKKDMAKEEYHYMLASLCSAYMAVNETGKAKQYIPALIAYFGKQRIHINQTVCEFTEKALGADSAMRMLEKCIALNKFNHEMEEQLKRLYTAKHGSEKGFIDHLAAIKSTYRNSMKAELANMIQNEKAPEFSLINLKGEEVSLSSLKGKVVIIDFWATWCAPCKASFPAMQQLVNDYSNNKDQVEFLFISSGEHGADIKALVQKYIQSTSFTFNVLLDSPADLAAKAFRISAFPTKLLIDKQGFIRFKPSHTENYDDMKMEMKIMIDFLVNK